MYKVNYSCYTYINRKKYVYWYKRKKNIGLRKLIGHVNNDFTSRSSIGKRIYKYNNNKKNQIRFLGFITYIILHQVYKTCHSKVAELRCSVINSCMKNMTHAAYYLDYYRPRKNLTSFNTFFQPEYKCE